VIGVEHNPKVLAEAQERLKRQNFKHVTLLSERIEALSIASASIDFALFSQE